MIRRVLVVFAVLFLSMGLTSELIAQCSICTKTAQQLGPGPARGMNKGILYLAATPFLIAGYIGYRVWKSKK